MSAAENFTQSAKQALTHCSRETIGKQCRPRSDGAELGIWSTSSVFANSLAIFLKEYVILIAGHT